MMASRGFEPADRFTASDWDAAPSSADPGNEVTLLIDGDVVAFTAASAVQRIFEDEFGFFSPFASRTEGEAVMANIMVSLKMDLKATHVRVFLTDPRENWRRDVWPAYKEHRKGTSRPLLLEALKDVLRKEYGATHWGALEADDVLGILNTEPQEYPGKRILVGKDKDFLTVPGLYHRMGNFDEKRKPIIFEITPWEAQQFHLKQTLMGDATDGYPGCPGIGKARAEEILTSPQLLTPQPGVITRGVNKGNSITKWVSEPTKDVWHAIVSHYRKGMGGTGPVVPWGEAEKAALVTARLAYILHHEDYDRETETIRLWEPGRIGV